MSSSFSLVCRETKQKIWIGQGFGKAESLYSGEPQTMANLRLFLNEHANKPIEFVNTDFDDQSQSYEEWAGRPIADDDDFGQLLLRSRKR
jgi:hypothetical protein